MHRPFSSDHLNSSFLGRFAMADGVGAEPATGSIRLRNRVNQKVTPGVIGKSFLQVSTPTENAQMSEPQFTEQDWRRFLSSLGENPDSAGLVETPSRAAKAWKHWTAGDVCDQKRNAEVDRRSPG